MLDLAKRTWKTYVTDVRDEADAESAAYRASTPASVVTRRIAIVVVGAALCMMIIRFAGNIEDPKWMRKILVPIGLGEISAWFEQAVTKAPDRKINQRIWWAIARVVAYLVIPLAIARFLLKSRASDMGLSIRGASQWRLYALMLAVVMPFVVAASYGTGFQAKYPYYRVAPGEPLFPGFVMWELLYAVNFLGVEFFFRGFFLHGLRREVGYACVFFPLVPYVTIHWGKPLAEAVGSIITGFVLATMSLKTRSVWGGTFLHVFVAVSMDCLSLWHRGLL